MSPRMHVSKQANYSWNVSENMNIYLSTAQSHFIPSQNISALVQRKKSDLKDRFCPGKKRYLMLHIFLLKGHINFNILCFQLSNTSLVSFCLGLRHGFSCTG